jgi:hypothetical protein
MEDCNRIIMHPQANRLKDRYEHLFVVQHMLNTVATNVSTNADNVWYVDSRAFNHMTYHGEWFRDVKNLEKPGYVEMGDDSSSRCSYRECAISYARWQDEVFV